MDVWTCIAVLYVVLTFIGGFVIAIYWWATTPDNEIKLIWLPNGITNSWCNEHNINKIGHCIADIAINIVLGPATILALLILGLSLIPVYGIMLFAWIFRKR